MTGEEGEKTVWCHFHGCVLSHFSSVWLCDPMGCSLPGSSVLGILQARILWSGLPWPPPGDLPNPGIGPGSRLLQADFLPSEPPGKHKLDNITPLLNILQWNKIPHTFNKIQLSTRTYQNPNWSGLFDLISFSSLYFFLALFCLNTLPSNIYTASFLS